MAVQIGSMSPRETHDSREIERLKKGRVTTYRYNGDYGALASMQPEPGDKRDGGTVRTSVLRRLQGGAGLLEYTVARKGSTAGGGAPDPFDQLEIEMAQTERPILAHTKFSPYADEIDAWRNGPEELRCQYKYEYFDENGEKQVGTLGEGTGADGLYAAKLIQKGVESYLVFHPVVTLTSEHEERPSDYGRDIGRRGPPTVSGYPGGYDWLKTADRLQRGTDGAWTRVQQWTGADANQGGWDVKLYRPAGG